MVQQTNPGFKEYFLKTDRPMLLDGATGTKLMSMGLKPGECGELWNLQYPDKIESIARMYFNAGSDAVLTNTFGAISLRLKRHGLQKSVYDINRAGAEIVRQACPPGKFVLGNIGPSPEPLEPYGELQRDELVESYSEQVRGLVEGGVDGFSLETFAGLDEMHCAIKAIIGNESNLPYLCSMTFNKTQRGYFTNNGISVQRVFETLELQSAFAIGSNCGNGIENMIEIARQFRQFSIDARLIFQPNAGMPKLIDGAEVYSETPEFFVLHLPKLLSYRPSIIGGCCGTTPEHVKVMREFLYKNY